MAGSWCHVPGEGPSPWVTSIPYDMGLFFSLLPLTTSFAAGMGRDRDSAAPCRAVV